MSTVLMSTVKRIENKERRTIKFKWKNEDSSREISLEVAHYFERKYFGACVTRATTSETNTGFSVREFAPFDDVFHLGKESVARFSMPKLQEYADKVLAEFIAQEDDYTPKSRVIAWRFEAESFYNSGI